MTRFLVTGGAGLIGSAVCRLINDEMQEPLVVIDKLTYAGNLSSLALVSDNQNFVFIKQDLGDRQAIADILREHRPDIVMNLAAESHVDRSIDGPSAFIETNIVGTYALMEACQDHFETLGTEGKSTFRFHHISTDEVFGQLPLDDSLFTEETA